MPPLEVCDLVDDAILWTVIGVNGRGEKIVGPPQSIKCNWVESSTETSSPKESDVSFDATAEVAVSIPMNSIMKKGTLASIPGTGTGTNEDNIDISNLFQVKRTSEVTDLKGRHTTRVVGLTRFNGTLPLQ